MKTKLLFVLLAGSLLALAARLVHVPNPAQADEIPEKYRDTVSKGLEYLAKNQHKDGHWEGDGGKHPVAMTGLVGLALFMDGGVARESKHLANTCKAADWLMDKSQAGRDGLIYSDHPSETARYMQGHGLATLFLAGACKKELDPARRRKLEDTLTRAVKYIVNAQSSQGGWYHTSKVEGHDFNVVSATVIQIQALQAAENAGIPVPKEAINDAQEYLKMALGKNEEPAKSGQNRNRPTETAAALACGNTLIVRRIRTDALCKKWLKYRQEEIPLGLAVQFGRDDLTHYYYAQAEFNRGVWSDYSTAMFDHVQSSQNKDGSWPTALASQGGIGVGPVYSTALWCTIFQLGGDCHPSTQRVQQYR